MQNNVMSSEELLLHSFVIFISYYIVHDSHWFCYTTAIISLKFRFVFHGQPLSLLCQKAFHLQRLKWAAVKLTAAEVIVNEILQCLKIIKQKKYLCWSYFIQETSDKKVSFSEYICFDRYPSHRYPVTHMMLQYCTCACTMDAVQSGRAGTSWQSIAPNTIFLKTFLKNEGPSGSLFCILLDRIGVEIWVR